MIPDGCTARSKSRWPTRTQMNRVLRGSAFNLPREFESARFPRFAGTEPARQTFFRSAHSAAHRSPKTERDRQRLVATDIHDAEMSFLQAEIRDPNPDRVLDNHDLSVTDQRPPHQNVDVVARRTRHADHVPGPRSRICAMVMTLRPSSISMSTGTSAKSAISCRGLMTRHRYLIKLMVVLAQFVDGSHHLGIGLISALVDDQVGEFGRDIYRGRFHGAALQPYPRPPVPGRPTAGKRRAGAELIVVIPRPRSKNRGFRMVAMASWPTTVCCPLENCARIWPPLPIATWTNWAAGEPSCETAEVDEGWAYWRDARVTCRYTGSNSPTCPRHCPPAPESPVAAARHRSGGERYRRD